MTRRTFASIRSRALACLMALTLCLGLVPALETRTAAATTLDYALDKAVEWGFMRGDISGNLRAGDPITRAEFVTIVNRAFGYQAMGGEPFTDVSPADWYGQDVDIAYTEGYILGTTPTTFSPRDNLTREQAVVILARNLRMQGDPGEDTSFSDSRLFNDWSRGLIQQAVRYGIVSGYSDGSFRPKNAITRGAAAILLVNAIGTPVQTEGVHTLGDVFGNVTITSSGVTLRDTVVAGNLYITDGVDLGSVTLENVRVLGQIVITGGGASEGGDDSMVLRNVDAPELIVDTLRGQQISVRVEGDGVIDTATFRTSAYVEDNAPDGAGLQEIRLDGSEETALSVAGNIKEVINLTPGSALNLVSGTAAVITVDEAATNSTLHLEAGAVADEVNLDTATTVTGNGDISHLTVNAPGSTVPMLPDQITIRPGITANVSGEEMDSTAAAESSADPRLLGGYPRVTNLAPTSATAEFSGNKSGTVYWAVTPITAGSVEAEELITPPAYTTTIVGQGSVSLTGSGNKATANLTRLTTGGSYYLSAVFVDAREEQSPVKVISFTTPDNTVPAFADNYPYLSRITSVSAQVTVMATKTCQLYYAVLPRGAAAPTANDFLSASIPGNYGYGSRPVTKNTEYSFDVNDRALEELKDYVLYLWLTDLEGGQSSRVVALNFTTVDGTPPRFNTVPTVNRVQETSVGLYANLNENGTLFWVLVPNGEPYPKPLAGESGAVDLASDTAKIQVANGMNGLNSGRVNMTEGRDVTFNITGLEPETAYDLYYVARDAAGNYSDRVGMITIHTLDANAPTVTQEFTEYNGDETTVPLPSTDIRLVFSEAVEYGPENRSLVDYYQAVQDAAGTSGELEAREEMAAALRASICFYVDSGSGPAKLATDAVDLLDPNDPPENMTEATAPKASGGWVIDYRFAQITLEDGHTVVTFPTEDTVTNSALNLASGGSYYFEIQADSIADTSDAQNTMGRSQLPPFTTVFAIVNLSQSPESMLPESGVVDSKGDPVSFDSADSRELHVSWRLDPASTESVQDGMYWDMIIWSDTSIAFELYRRPTNIAGAQWEKVGGETSITVTGAQTRVGVSMNRIEEPSGNRLTFQELNDLDEDTTYEYGLHFTRIGTLTSPSTWTQRVTIGVTVVAGNSANLQNLALINGVTDTALESVLQNGVTNIGQPDDFTLYRQFSDQTPPMFILDTPYFEAGDSTVRIYYTLDRPGTVYYVVAPLPTIPTSDGTHNFSTVPPEGGPPSDIEASGPQYAYYRLPERGSGTAADYPFKLTSPTPLQILNPSFQNPSIFYDSQHGEASENMIQVDGLQSNTNYIAYFVVQSESSQVYSDQVYAYRFTTGDVEPAYIKLQANNANVIFTTSQDANLYYALYAYNSLPTLLTTGKLQEHAGTMLPTGVDGSMTLYEAMRTTVDNVTGESLFDRYVRQSTKDQIYQEITSQNTGSSALSQGSHGMTINQSWSNNFTPAMSETSATSYVCLATAQNRLGGQWTFKAVSGVRILDNTPPVLTNVHTVITSDIPVGGTPKTLNGFVTLTFSEDIYYLPSSRDAEDLQMIVQADNPLLDSGQTMDGYVGFLNITTQTPGGVLSYASGGGGTNPSSVITLTFRNAWIGQTFTFPSSGYLADATASSNESNRYTLTLRQVTDGGGAIPNLQGVYRYEVTDGTYNGTYN